MSQALVDDGIRQILDVPLAVQIACVRAFATVDLSPDLKGIDVPVLLLHGTADESGPYALTAVPTAELIRDSRLVTYDGAPHGLYVDPQGRGERGNTGLPRMKPVNDVLFFACELAALVALGIWGRRVGSGWSSWVLVAAAPLAMAVAWGFLAAPTSDTRLADPALLAFQLVVLELAALAWWSVGGSWWAVGLGGLTLLVVTGDRLLA